MDAGRVLREARRRAHMTQRAVAAKAGVPQSMIARIESRAVVPRVDTLDRLLEACGEGLYAHARAGVGVDKTLARELRKVGPAARLGAMHVSAERLYALNPSMRARVAEEGGRFATDARGAIEILSGHHVEFIVIGGVAANLHGSPLLTHDFDICYRRGSENVARLVAALRELGATLRGVPEGAPNVVDERTFRLAVNLTFSTEMGSLDCLGEPMPGLFYEQLEPNVSRTTIDDIDLGFASISDLIRMKRYAGRPKDLIAIEELAALQGVIDDEPPRA